jgi:prophage regulatory protein
MKSKAVICERGTDVVALSGQTSVPAAPVNGPIRLLRFSEVRQRIGLSRSTIWRMERSGIFPKRVRVSVNVVAWREDEVSEWIRSKVERG